MAVSIRTLRYDAELVSSGYTAGATAIEQANRRIAASTGQVAQAINQTDVRLAETGTRLERLTRQIDPAYNAQQRFETGLRTLDNAMARGRLSTERYEQLLGMLQRRYREANDNLNQH